MNGTHIQYHSLAVALALGIALTGLSSAASSATWESLIMPGPVAEAHAEVESTCTSCHTAFSREDQEMLCMACHEDIASDLDARGGFHGKNPEIVGTQCRTCHTDHLGRDADITGLVPESFDHSLTEFQLSGAHEIQACVGCHAPDTLYRDTPSQCIDCHESDDTHNQGLGTECGQCHTSTGWASTQFDHGKQAEYSLVGAHAQQPCTSCHIDNQYEDTPAMCVDCHKLDDVHSGSRGDECQSCHTEEAWTEATYDHLRETEFELVAAHAALSCGSCHLDNMSLKQPPTDCFGCHSSNDVHQGLRGNECGDCHDSQEWKIAFGHEQETGFALLGAHDELRCDQCHKGSLEDDLPNTCEECHRETDPHNGTLGACDSCHGSAAWTSSLRFDHEFTNFPLFGLHQLATCEQCHFSQQFDNAEPDCIACHQADDTHAGTFGASCSDCHSPGGWDLWRFDHDTQTTFALTGSHENLICDACHKKGAGGASMPSQQCNSCHLVDDAHNGQFGNRCERCHTTETFTDSVRFR